MIECTFNVLMCTLKSGKNSGSSVSDLDIEVISCICLFSVRWSTFGLPRPKRAIAVASACGAVGSPSGQHDIVKLSGKMKAA